MSRRSLQTAAAWILTGVAAFWHIYYVFHAGGLWRDESNTVALATLPTLSDVIGNLQYDSFPMLWLLVVRGLSTLGLTTDIACRVLGCFVGLSILAAIWINASVLKFPIPVVSLVLVGFSPAVIRWGDSMRAYGLGICLILLTFAAIWRLLIAPRIITIALAAIVAVCSVQTLYHDAPLLFAICVSGFVVAACRRQWKRGFLVGGIGALAAASLLPYLGAIHRAGQWNVVFRMPNYDIRLFLTKLTEALSPAGVGFQWFWLVLLGIAVVSVIVAVRVQRFRADRDATGEVLYCFIALLVGVPVYFLFLKVLRYPTQVWYYVALIGFAAILLEGCLFAGRVRWLWVQGRWVMALCAAIWSFFPAWQGVHIRQTNIDIAAYNLNQSAGPNDTIIVYPWYNGVSFNRYYHGAASWNTIPPIEFHTFHRYDLLKEKMEAPNDPMGTLLQTVGATLRNGNRVWIVGNVPLAPLVMPPIRLAPAPYDPVGWNDDAYATSWALQLAYFIQTHARGGEGKPPLILQPVNSFEDVALTVFWARQPAEAEHR